MNKRNYAKELENIIKSVEATRAGKGPGAEAEAAREGKKPGAEMEAQECHEGESGSLAPSLLLHACCAPCSSYCLEYLCKYFRITVFYYNPNISMQEEYERRVSEEKRLITAYNEEMSAGTREGFRIEVIEGEYEPEKFYEAVKGLEKLGENSERCKKCFELRLRKTAELMKKAKLSAEGHGEPEDSVKALKGSRKTPAFDYFTTTLTISPLKNADWLNEIGERLAKEYGLKWLPSDFKKKDGYKRSIELSREYELYRQDYCGCAFSKAERDVFRAAD